MAVLRRGPPLRRRRMEGGVKNCNFWPISHSISPMIQDRAIVSYYTMRVGNRTQAFEWYHLERH